MAAIGRMRLADFPAWVLWFIVHLAALTGFKNRLSVFDWTAALLGGGRAERVITFQQVFGRRAMAARTVAPDLRPGAVDTTFTSGPAPANGPEGGPRIRHARLPG